MLFNEKIYCMLLLHWGRRVKVDQLGSRWGVDSIEKATYSGGVQSDERDFSRTKAMQVHY